jgi:L,D-transpeptidase YcbB
VQSGNICHASAGINGYLKERLGKLCDDKAGRRPLIAPGRVHLHTVRFDRLLAGTALGLVLALSAPAFAGDDPISAQVPMPESANMPPPTAKDIGIAAPVQAAPVQAPAPVAATPAAAPAVATDTALSDKVRDAVAKADRLGLRKSERDAMNAFYKDRNYAPLWVSNNAANDRAKAAADYLSKVDRDGLDPAEYATPEFKGDADALADAEIKMTGAVLTYARHALNGRVAWSRISADVYYDGPSIETPEVLSKLAGATDVAATLDSFEPQAHQYKDLKKALADVRANGHKKEEKAAEAPKIQVPEGKTLKPGMKDERVLALRQRLDLSDKDNTTYDKTVSDAVKAFQKANQIAADGNLGVSTVKALNGVKAEAAAKLGDPVDTIIVNLDRWRWMPRDLGNPYVIVNIPDYRLTLFKDDKVYWSTKIVVGLLGKPTPLISAQMKFITVNPTWNVPPSIIQNEYLPALREDPGALDRIGLKVEQAPDGTVRIWQPPGAGNALGRIRFNFPNKFLVYQHDTPDKYLFAKERRAFSHGCMRVENPLMYGEKLLSLTLPNENYTAARLEKMFGGSEVNINFPESKYIQVNITYQTAFVDADGKLQLREDVYGRDARMFAQLKGSERKVADIPMERAPNTSAKPVRMEPGTYGGQRGGGNFLEWMFGGRQSAVPAPRASRGTRTSFR